MLKSHKLKITVLEPGQKQAGEVGRKKKKKKQRRDNESSDGPVRKKPEVQLKSQPSTSFTHLLSQFGISRRLAENVKVQRNAMPTKVQKSSATSCSIRYAFYNV